MLVGERMSHPVICISPELSINEALTLFKKERIRRAPVVRGNKLVGIVSEKDLFNASPSPANAISVWEMNYLLCKLTIAEVMTKSVITIKEDTPVEEAACIMVVNKIGGLPVVQGSRVAGIITETDLFRLFLELLGAREKGVRVTTSVLDQPGTLARVTRAIADAGGNFIAFGQFIGDDAQSRMLTFKINNLSQAEIKTIIHPLCKRIFDIREI